LFNGARSHVPALLASVLPHDTPFLLLILYYS
jgi:hypothetical protein